ncbi:FeoA family protein [Maridesulfovibrio hydrothermalis]|uniref:FeoA family protein n=1 Tax=Maridesulfovibrio hydrothermalis AM13 = DSM 14728 TaxID=1121451 RepID=L0R9N5_9BACT|nr:FeoA family protein [Maridesulfovibrio hydrothermalis]CCO22912.1 FeoA family protein [Maridesulfovibrio hydrothermalis AM13 = DSM 14728]
MLIPLSKAPIETMLTLKSISCSNLKNRLQRMGLHTGTELEIMSEDSIQHPVRVKGPKGEVLLAAGMASKVITHHDDGHITPVFEMNPGETGHIEGLTAGSHLEKSLKILGISEGDNIELVRCLPPMEYKTVVDGRQTSLTEGMAAKIWGDCDNTPCQLATCGKGRLFKVKNILGGPRAVQTISAAGIRPGSTITLESVQPAKDIRMDNGERIIIRTKDGLRLHLRIDQADTLLVEQIQ